MAYDVDVKGDPLQPQMKDMLDHLEEQRYSKASLSVYKCALGHLMAYMNTREINEYSPVIGDDFIESIIAGRDYKALSGWEQQIVNVPNAFSEYCLLGVVKFRRCKTRYSLIGEIGNSMDYYVKARSDEYGLSESSIDLYRYQLRQFLLFLETQNIKSIEKISRPSIMKYIEGLSLASKQNLYRNLSIIKKYLRYIYESGAIKEDFSRIILKPKRIRQPELPSVYTKEEVQKMLTSVERSNPKGKRDYAMLLLVVRYGLRASDICELTFSSLDWTNSKIVLTQQKTKKKLELPLLAEVGEAIIDYLKYGRPESVLQYVFLHVIAPFDRLYKSTLHSIVTQYIRLAGISNKPPRKHGPHALRHSLAAVLLEKKIPLPVISEVLGHESVESTRYYIRVDMNSLMQCAIDVPPLRMGSSDGGDGSA